MKEKPGKDNPNVKSCFLQKFQGKLNVITKHGEIHQEKDLKLPVINSPLSKRFRTMNFRPSKDSVQSFFSEGRTETSKSAIMLSRVEKYLVHTRQNDFSDLESSFLKHTSKNNLKKSTLKHKTVEPLSALPFSNKFSLPRQQEKLPVVKDRKYTNAEKIKSHDYEDSLK